MKEEKEAKKVTKVEEARKWREINYVKRFTGRDDMR